MLDKIWVKFDELSSTSSAEKNFLFQSEILKKKLGCKRVVQVARKPRIAFYHAVSIISVVGNGVKP